MATHERRSCRDGGVLGVARRDIRVTAAGAHIDGRKYQHERSDPGCPPFEGHAPGLRRRSPTPIAANPNNRKTAPAVIQPIDPPSRGWQFATHRIGRIWTKSAPCRSHSKPRGVDTAPNRIHVRPRLFMTSLTMPSNVIAFSGGAQPRPLQRAVRRHSLQRTRSSPARTCAPIGIPALVDADASRCGIGLA